MHKQLPTQAERTHRTLTAYTATNSAASIATLTVNSGKNVTILSGNTLTITSGISFDGTSITNNGIVRFNGSTSISGSGNTVLGGTIQVPSTSTLPSNSKLVITEGGIVVLFYMAQAQPMAKEQSMAQLSIVAKELQILNKTTFTQALFPFER